MIVTKGLSCFPTLISPRKVNSGIFYVQVSKQVVDKEYMDDVWVVRGTKIFVLLQEREIFGCSISLFICSFLIR